MAEQTVKESTSGTITETKEQANASSKEEVKTPVDASKVSSEKTEDEPTLTRKQAEEYADRLVQIALSEPGRRIKELEAEVNTYKTKAENLETDISENQKEIESLQQKLDDMSSDNPERLDLVKEIKAAREERKQLKADRRKLESEQKANEEIDKERNQWKRDQVVYTVADEYVTADGKAVDMDSFKNAADKFNLNEREQLVSLAETLGFKPKSGNTANVMNEILHIDSGNTDGGGEETFESLMKKDVKKMSYQEKLEHQKKLNEARKKITS